MEFVTEIEAKKRICRAPIPEWSRGDGSFCLGAKCMMWRWQAGHVPFEFHKVDFTNPDGSTIRLFDSDGNRIEENWTTDEMFIPKKAMDEWPGPDWLWNDEEYGWHRACPERRKGFCGLAGRPVE